MRMGSAHLGGSLMEMALAAAIGGSMGSAQGRRSRSGWSGFNQTTFCQI